MDGQLKLKAAKVLLIGTGGLGAPLGLYLTAAGVGKIGLVDFDVVDFTNLQRQITFGTSDIGKPKTAAAHARLSNLNPDIEITTYETRLTSENALELFKDYDIIVDGTDNFPTRYLVNDACVLLGKPNVYGSIFRFEGQVTVFGMPDGPCYRCLYPEPPPPGLVPSCAEGGVLGVLPGIIGSLQAMETIKLILGRGDSLEGRLVLFDALAMNAALVIYAAAATTKSAPAVSRLGWRAVGINFSTARAAKRRTASIVRPTIQPMGTWERATVPERSRLFNPKKPIVSIMPDSTKPNARIKAMRSCVPRKRTSAFAA